MGRANALSRLLNHLTTQTARMRPAPKPRIRKNNVNLILFYG